MRLQTRSQLDCDLTTWIANDSFVRNEASSHSRRASVTQFTISCSPTTMQNHLLFPPNLHSLSSNVIGDVALRSDNNNYVTTHSFTTQFFMDEHQRSRPNLTKATTTGRRQSRPILPAEKLPYADEMKENVAAYHRERRWKNQERYRTKQRQWVEAFELRNHKMEEEIRQLERTRDILTAKRPATGSTVWSVAVEYFQVFRHGLPASGSVRAAAMDFLQAVMASGLDAGTVQGSEALARNWTVFAQFFQDVQVRLNRLEEITENSLVATTTTSFTITKSSISNIFPHLTNYGVDLGKGIEGSPIVAKLLNQRIVMRGSVHFWWDSDNNNRVVRLISQADMVSPLLGVLGNLKDVATVFNYARINTDCNIVVPAECSGGRFECSMSEATPVTVNHRMRYYCGPLPTSVTAIMESSPQKAWRAAAEKLAAADFLLLATGAGFSADSALPVYAYVNLSTTSYTTGKLTFKLLFPRDIAKVDAYDKMGVEYQDLCDPYMLEQDEEVFYGFWGGCTNSYRDTKHHRGYQILRKWRDAIRSKGSSTDERRNNFQAAFDRLKKCEALPAGVTSDSVTNDPFFVYTSNVDSHFKRDFDKKEVYELHGSVENWQCAGDVETGAREPCEQTWKLPAEFRFDLDEVTMKAPGAEATTCPECGGKGRPNVLMFHDRQWIANTSEENGYIAWESVMELMLEDDPTLNLVVLEIGCGTRVPSVRRETEMVVADVIEGCGRPQATLIRVNPETPTCDNPLILANNRFLPIASKGLEALEGIDRELVNLRQGGEQ
ncbi:hypothetical protein P3T76_001561 [Phytophthora citrophthora]|uniref:Deacetylase sirtuin-type domain-containing protein n=1 Tax=Phytophthora citrophthora TaxID=4793 RepID=A0AAD9H0Y1_9STRA|nr:hypothetical protein P3T76_001561 [Phytophthora citrophthora]